MKRPKEASFSRLKSVAYACLRQDVLGLLGPDLQFLAQVDPEILHVHLWSPDLLHDHAVRENSSSVKHEQAQDVPLLVRQLHFGTCNPNNPTREIDSQVTVCEQGLCSLAL